MIIITGGSGLLELVGWLASAASSGRPVAGPFPSEPTAQRARAALRVPQGSAALFAGGRGCFRDESQIPRW